MTHLSEILAIEDNTERQSALKRSMMSYTEPVAVDGTEEELLTILLNLSQSKPKCKDFRDDKRAKQYFKTENNLEKAIGEIKWVHTHNLKYPDSRVSEQRLFVSCDQALGWAHNSATYPHTIWLLNSFYWQSEETCLLKLFLQQSVFWVKLLSKFGLTKVKFKHVLEEIDKQLGTSSFPESVSTYSKQIRLPYYGSYLSVTPVVSHQMQIELERLARKEADKPRLTNLELPHPASIGNLCGSLGGHMRLIYSPTGARHGQTLANSRKQTEKFFDNYQLTNKRTAGVLRHLTGQSPQITKQRQRRARVHQVKILRKQIALWLLPLIELKEQRMFGELVNFDCQDELICRFIKCELEQLPELVKSITHRIHYELQENRYTRKFAYHPQLIQPIRTQVEWILKQLATGDEPEQTFEGEQYLYLSGLRAEDVQAQSSPYVVGAPSLTGVWGFVHRYQLNTLDVINDDIDFDFSSFAIFVRNERIYHSAKLSEFNDTVAKRQVSAAKRPTIRSDIYSDLEFDLVIKVNTRCSLRDYEKQLKAALPSNFCGGVVFPPKINSSITPWVSDSKSSLFFKLKGLSCSGVWLEPTKFNDVSLNALASALVDDSSFVAISNGYRLLENPKLRDGAITSDHAYAENVVSLGERVNPIDYRLRGANSFFSSAFWSLQIENEAILIKKDE